MGTKLGTKAGTVGKKVLKVAGITVFSGTKMGKKAVKIAGKTVAIPSKKIGKKSLKLGKFFTKLAPGSLIPF